MVGWGGEESGVERSWTGLDWLSEWVGISCATYMASAAYVLSISARRTGKQIPGNLMPVFPLSSFPFPVFPIFRVHSFFFLPSV